MPGFEDSAFIVLLALLLFGPKKLPVLARQLGKLMADFRRASSEFRTQMEDELRVSEQAERQKQIEATPIVTPAIAPPVDPAPSQIAAENPPLIDSPTEATSEALQEAATPEDVSEPTPIATAGALNLMPPATGLPTPHSAVTDLSSTDTAIPHQHESETEALHG